MVALNTNLVRYSGMLDKGPWAEGNLAVIPVSNIGSPTGHTWRAIATGLEGPTFTQYLYQGGIPEFTQNAVFTASVWVRRENWSSGQMLLQILSTTAAGSLGMGQLFHPNGNDSGVEAAIVLTAPNIAPWTNVVGGVEHLAAQWERIWVQGRSSNTPNAVLGVTLTSFGGPTPGFVGSSFLIGGFALDLGVNTTFADTTTAPRGNEFLPVFDFPYHVVETRYPQNGTTVQFGKSYTFTAKPDGPPQRNFALEFPTLVWETDDFTGLVDPTTRPQTNAYALDTFYNLVQLWQPFHYMHPVYGQLVVRFARALVLPKQIVGGSGAIAPVTLEFIEVP